MRVPTIQGIIRRRVLVNYRVDPGVMQRVLPARFKPQLYGGYAIAGICLIRLEGIRPRAVPRPFGLCSENAAHRVAVSWNDRLGDPREGVFIPRRDTDSRLNHWLGGRFFPGEHHQATFTIDDTDDQIKLAMKSDDGCIAVEVNGRVAERLPEPSIFESLGAASAFFESGKLGYSPTRNPCRFDGIVLDVDGWQVRALQIDHVFSSYFADESRFPRGSVEFDHALIMRDLVHQWHAADDLCA